MPAHPDRGDDSPSRGRAARHALRRAARGLGVLLGLGTVLVGLAHTSLGRPLMDVLARTAGCPVSLEGSDPGRVEAFRRAHVRALRGATPARSRPALGFELGRTTARAVDAWARRRGADCAWRRQHSVLHCTGAWNHAPEGGTWVGARDLHLQFDASRRLVAVDLFRETTCARRALAELEARQASLTRKVGPPTRTFGDRRAALLDAHPYYRVATEYRYRDYLGRLSAMGRGATGVQVREQYQWIPEG